MKKLHKIILICLGVVLLILIITNPTTNRFKEFLYSQGIAKEEKCEQFTYGKESNYFIFSSFKYRLIGCSGEASHSGKCLGILGNFYYQ